jgi:acyl carrier protein
MLRGLVRAPRRAAAAAAAGTGAPAPAAAGSAGLVDLLTTMAEADARAHLADLVRSHVAAVLAHGSVDDVDKDRAFSELGFDSLTAVELRNRLNADTGLRLPATLVFDHPTVSALARFVFQSLAPSAPSAEDTLRSALERVESILAAANGDAKAIRTKLVAILQSGLTRFAVDPHNADTNGAGSQANNIHTASDEEIFALIDKEL